MFNKLNRARLTAGLITLAMSGAVWAQTPSATPDEAYISNAGNETPVFNGAGTDFSGMLFVGSSLNPVGGNHTVFAIDPVTDMATPSLATNIWGATADFANDRILFTSSAGSSNGDNLYAVPITGGAAVLLGQITDAAGAPQRIDGLAISGGVLYGSYAGASAVDGLWTIDPDTQVATLIAPWSDSISGIDADPDTGIIYGVNDSTGFLVSIETNGTRTNVAAYPAGFTDIDGLAVGGGFAYLVTDEPGNYPVYDLNGGAYITPLTSPFTSSDTFSGAAIAIGGGGTGEGPARFQVSKVFNDGNTAEVDVVIQCNTGLPLMQPASISEGDPVTFVVGDFEDGAMTCEVTESVPAGYTASYNNGDADSDTGCVFEAVGLGSFNTCVISNSLNEVDVEVTKVWIDENPQFNPVNYAEAAWSCSNVAFACPLGGNNGCDTGTLSFLGNPATDGFSVFPRWDGATTCSVDEVIISDGNVEVDDSECNSITLFPGVGASCTIYNTRLYAGIPTLSQYGLVIMALLMLGLGLVGFRRFV